MTNRQLPASLTDGLELPLIVAPMFLVSGVDLVAAACRNGTIGALPSLNARSPEILDAWLKDLTTRLEDDRQSGNAPAPWAVNLVVHSTNKRLAPDLHLCVKYRAPLIITALGGPRAVVDTVHSYGGLVFADVNTPAYARKAADTGVDGLVLVCSGAGGHTGPMTAPAFVASVRSFFDGIIVVAGGLTSGQHLRAVQAMGADLGYMGTNFIATEESLAQPGYKQMVVDSQFSDIICTNAITGAYANKLRPSLVAAGLDPDNLKPRGKFEMASAGEDQKAWRDLWSAGHSVEQVKAIRTTAEAITEIGRGYDEALAAELNDPWRRMRQTTMQATKKVTA
ncbi:MULTISPECIES: nitronate monooxygenase [unclassified Beijerinckia]|uniref:NAD(P)H-dependent flavin oxidoreductase n=1 Tax=unclassified Beijerinckia TaxID=2638183 RepID=UPI0008941CBC|nr:MULTISPECIES: nitronate monooxygenase [unclassified Beijerinckia]MDH7796319.1 nitronate monooxygenase [Beijerinckia sp. GAS462]SEC39885.1 nitronate monooxygenase [Beijerinckia sp. 28-YEA-48]